MISKCIYNLVDLNLDDFECAVFFWILLLRLSSDRTTVIAGTRGVLDSTNSVAFINSEKMYI